MKKSIKIILLTIFIVLFLGITTSNVKALVVESGTTADEMISTINAGGFLKGISNTVRKENPNLYCRQHHQHISETTKYLLDKTAKSVTYSASKEAYILAGPEGEKEPGKNNNYKETSRQFAWWQILKQEDGQNALFGLAVEYQNFMETYGNKKVTVSVDENKMIKADKYYYVPVTIKYPYKKAIVSKGTKNELSDTWGGFDYKFNNEDVTLCDENYKEITSTSKDGYKQVRSDEYSGKKLYIKIPKDLNLSKIKLSVKGNIVKYEATVYNIAGTYSAEAYTTIYCLDCQENQWKKDKAEKFSTQIKFSDIEDGRYVKYNNCYYKFLRSQVNTETTNAFSEKSNSFEFNDANRYEFVCY